MWCLNEHPPSHLIEWELSAVIPNPEQIHVSEGYCPKSACCLIEVDHRELALLESRASDSGYGFYMWGTSLPGPFLCLDSDRDAKPRCMGRMWCRDGEFSGSRWGQCSELPGKPHGFPKHETVPFIIRAHNSSLPKSRSKTGLWSPSHQIPCEGRNKTLKGSKWPLPGRCHTVERISRKQDELASLIHTAYFSDHIYFLVPGNWCLGFSLIMVAVHLLLSAGWFRSRLGNL